MLSIIPACFQQFFTDQLGLYSIQNYGEVLIFSFIIYKMLRWLQKDQTKQLVLYVYAYTGCMITSYAFSFSTLFFTLFFMAPIAMLLCIIAHQKQLQKNFLVASNVDFNMNRLPTKNWLQLFIRSCLLVAYQKKNIICIMQRSDNLSEIIESSCNLYVPIQSNILDLLLLSNALHQPSIFWITDFGFINGVNVTWKPILKNQLLSDQHEHTALLKLITTSTDAFAWTIDPNNRLASLWHQGKVVHNLTIDQLLKTCHTILQKKNTVFPFNQSGIFHGTKNNTHHITP